MRRAIRRFLKGERGSVAIQLGLAAIVIFGMVALGVEITFLLYKHRQMQAAADAAALGAVSAKTTGHPSDFTLEAYALTAAVGYVNGVDGVTVTVNNPPLNGNYTSNTAAIEVTVSQPQILSLTSLFRSGLFNVGARAVAVAGDAGAYCILALETSAANAVTIKQNGIVSSPVCGVAANSTSSRALVLENNAQIFGPVSVAGNYSLANNAHLWYDTPPYPKTGAAPIADPYASVSFSTSGAPSRTQPSCTSVCNLQPGRYSAGLNYSNNKTLNFAAGVYFFDTRFSVNNNITINATSGVTIVFNGNYAANIGNNVTINITAPTSGDTAGIAMASLRTASTSITQQFSNNAILNLTGALYFPRQKVEFDNNSTINTPVCGQVIARLVSMQNNAYLRNDCSGTGVVPISSGAGGSHLVE